MVTGQQFPDFPNFPHNLLLQGAAGLGRDRSAGQLDPAFQLIRQGQGLICHELRTCGGYVILVI